MKKLILEFEEYLRQEEKSNITIEKYLRDVEKFSRFVGSNDVTKETVIEYKKSLIESGYATRSINSMLASLNSFLTYAGYAECRDHGIGFATRNIRLVKEEEVLRKIYQKYFALPEEGKGTMGERVFFARLAVSITCIVLCMSAMGFTAYAFFTASVCSNMNQIQAANFDLNVQKIEPQTGTSGESHESENTYILQPGDYKFVLERRGDASTGYCQIVLTPNDMTSIETSEAVFYTQQFGQVEDQAEPVNEREITITVGVAATVKFVPCWGTYAGEGVSTVNYAIDKKESTTTAQPENQSEPNEVKGRTSTESATSTEPTTITEESVLGNEDEKDDMVVESIEENNGTTTESAESAEDTTSLTELEE